MAEHLRVSWRDTSVDSKTSSDIRHKTRRAIILVALLVLCCLLLLFPVWSVFWKSENWKLWGKYIIAIKPALANGLF